MPEPNSTNTAKGREFQRIAAEVLGKWFGVEFELEHAIPIGDPAKLHRFDLVSRDGCFVGESKNYSWTESGNCPSAKMGFLNEAVFYLQHVASEKTRFIVLRRDLHLKKGSLAEHYVRANRHLLNGVRVFEIDVNAGVVNEVSKSATATESGGSRAAS